MLTGYMFYTTYAVYEDGLAHACDPTHDFNKAVDAYAETKDAGYPASVYLINLEDGGGLSIDLTISAQIRFIDRLNERGQEHPKWLA